MLKLLILALSLLSITCDEKYPFAEQDHIINLGQPTWDIAQTQFPNGLLVYYYEPYCLPCREFWPELETTAKKLFEAHSGIQIAKAECHDEVKLCDAHGVTSFPTLILYRQNKQPFEYRGPRTTQALQSWVKKVVDSVYDTYDNEDAFFSRGSVGIIDTGSPRGLTEAYKDLFDEVVIGKPGPTLKTRAGTGAATILTQQGESVSIGAGDSADDIKKKVNDILYVKKTSAPNFNGEMSKKIQGEEDFDFVLFFRTSKFKVLGEETKAFDKAANGAGDKNQIYAYVNVQADLLGQTIAKFFGVKEDSEPTVGILSKKGKVLRKYLLTDPITTDNVKKLVNNFKAGTAKRYYMSAEAPATNKDYIRELVSKNFAEVTSDPSLNVFVQFYFPWCEWCVKLEPTWKTLAYRLRNTKNAVIARIDVSQNDVEGFDLSEFPVLVFYPEGKNKKAIEYLSDRNIASLKKFLFEQAPSLKEEIEL